MNAAKMLPAACLVAAVGTSASAQTFGFELTGKDHTPGPIVFTMMTQPVTVELWGWFDAVPGGDLFASANFDVDAGDSEWSSSNVVLAGPGSSQGAINRASVTGLIATQAHDPSAGVFGSPDNPILLWTGEWTTTGPSPRSIAVSTSQTVDFSVFDEQGNISQLYPGSFRPPVLELRHVPFPSTSAALGGLLFITMRRRRT